MRTEQTSGARVEQPIVNLNFNREISRPATAAADNTAVDNSAFRTASFGLQGDVRRLGLEQRFASAATTVAAARPVFTENHPAAQGLKFSETKAINMLAQTANTGEVYRMPDGSEWRVSDVEDTGRSGFRAIVMQPVNENDRRVVVSFAGSGAQVGDWVNNLSQAGGNTPRQYRQAVSFAREYQNRFGSNVILTGHSLGGGLASYASLQTGLRATAINSAALSPNNLGGNALFNPSVKRNPNITQYYVPGEVLTNLDNVDLFDARPGNKVEIPGRYNRWLDPRATIGNHLLGNLATDVPAPVRVR